MSTKPKADNYRGVAQAAFEVAAKQTADLTLIKTRLEAYDDDEALRLMRAFLDCRKPVGKVTSDEFKTRAVN